MSAHGPAGNMQCGVCCHVCEPSQLLLVRDTRSRQAWLLVGGASASSTQRSSPIAALCLKSAATQYSVVPQQQQQPGQQELLTLTRSARQAPLYLRRGTSRAQLDVAQPGLPLAYKLWCLGRPITRGAKALLTLIALYALQRQSTS